MEGLSNFSRSYKEHPAWRSTNSSFMRVINDVSTGAKESVEEVSKKKKKNKERATIDLGRMAAARSSTEGAALSDRCLPSASLFAPISTAR